MLKEIRSAFIAAKGLALMSRMTTRASIYAGTLPLAKIRETITHPNRLTKDIPVATSACIANAATPVEYCCQFDVTIDEMAKTITQPNLYSNQLFVLEELAKQVLWGYARRLSNGTDAIHHLLSSLQHIVYTPHTAMNGPIKQLLLHHDNLVTVEGDRVYFTPDNIKNINEVIYEVHGMGSKYDNSDNMVNNYLVLWTLGIITNPHKLYYWSHNLSQEFAGELLDCMDTILYELEYDVCGKITSLEADILADVFKAANTATTATAIYMINSRPRIEDRTELCQYVLLMKHVLLFMDCNWTPTQHALVNMVRYDIYKGIEHLLSTAPCRTLHEMVKRLTKLFGDDKGLAALAELESEDEILRMRAPLITSIRLRSIK